MFLITGPTSPSVLSNMAISIEQHVDWVVDCLAYMRDNGHATIEPTNTAQDEWMRHVTELANATLYPRAHSWYVGTNMDGRERAFTIYIAGCGPYREECDQVVADGYRGFEFDATSTEGTSA
jgi:cyclohexanone monooxygenase